MKKITVVILMSVFVAYGVEIAWEKTYRLAESKENEARSVIHAFDGGYLILGSAASVSSSSVYLFKTDTAGSVLWEKTYNSGNWDKGIKLITTSDSNYLIVGSAGKGSCGADGRDVYVLKVDTVGDTLWQRTYYAEGFQEPSGIIETSEGNIIVVGFTDSYEGREDDAYVLKLDAAGDTLWVNHYGSGGWERAVDVAESRNGYVVIGYKRETDSSDADVYLMELDKDGSLLWDETYGGEGDDLVYDVVVTTVKGYLVVGSTTSYRAEGGHVYVFELDPYGGKLWEQLFGGTEQDVANAGVKIGYTGYMLAGWTASFGEGGKDVYLLEIDKGGNYQWEKTIGGQADDIAYSIIPTIDGYIVAGSSASFCEGGVDCYLIKLID